MGTEYLLDSNTVIEFLGGMLPSASVNQLNNIVDRDEHHLSVINQIELRKNYKIKLPDAVIAATALVHRSKSRHEPLGFPH
ncbi:MAG: hypothetical protein GVY26_07050 [Bacteroidetes bacterium]|jgi:predicted nucleic acid-binding protein|nr:hypothetical protein [Bacteroidota bacterium]